jgi:two-component system alkaline phosphatase synthesis response regulator PhoP
MTDSSKKILIVEDSKSYLFILKETLREAGFNVNTAENGEDGLSLAISDKPDLILSDITMPKMDGITMVKKLKEANIDVPVIFLTNLSDFKNVSEGLETSKDYIVKADTSVDDVVVKVKERLYLK